MGSLEDQDPNKLQANKDSVLPLIRAEAMAATFKALADPTRLRLLSVLFQGEICVNDLAEHVGISQSAVSHQLRILRNLRFVSHRKEGHLVYYHIDDEHIADLFQRSLEHSLHMID